MNVIHRSFGVIVVWYNPSISQIVNTEKLASFFNHVLIIDNSPSVTALCNVEATEFHYYWMGKNLGIATALNCGCRLAMDTGLKYVLMLDQDSVFESSMLLRHISSAKVIFSDQRVAVVASASQVQAVQLSPQTIEVKSAITSGSIIRLSSWQYIGGFNDALFIDQVDHDYCIRLRLRGFRVLVNLAINMLHTIGDPIEKKIFGFPFSSTNHNWQRRYYQVRNSLYLRRWYPSDSKPLILYWRDMIETIIGIVALERDRVRKLCAILIGIFDFSRNRMGAWQGKHQNAK